MSSPTPRCSVPLFSAFVVFAVAAAFACGHLTGRCSAPTRSLNPPTPDQQREKLGEYIVRHVQNIREAEYIELRNAVERHRGQVTSEEQATIDECLRVMRECRAERAKQRPSAQYAAEEE